MRRSRIYTPLPLSPPGRVELTGPAGHYLARVLRLSAGDPLALFNGDGKDYCGEIIEVQRQRVIVRLTGDEPAANESPLKITLVQALSRGERMDYSLQKATELGVVRIQPIVSHRVEVRLDGKRLEKRMAHWQGVVISACEQSGRAIVPEVRHPLSLVEWMKSPGKGLHLVLDPAAITRISSLPVAEDAVSVIVGPEGGFSDQEMNEIQSAGVKAVSLGPRVLRTETAGPAAIAVLQAMAGDI